MTIDHVEAIDRDLSQQEHSARMQRILSSPVPRGQDFERKLVLLLRRKERHFGDMRADSVKDRSARDIEAIRCALTGTLVR